MKSDELVGIITRTDVMSADPSRLYNRGNQKESLKVQLQSVQDTMTANPNDHPARMHPSQKQRD